MIRGLNLREKIVLIVAGLLIVCAAACGVIYVNGGFSLISGTTSTTSAQMHTITDSVGRSVSVPEEPKAIASMDSFSGTVCVLAGAGDRMIGAPGGVKSNTLLKRVCSDLGSKQTLSGATVNAETLLSAKVDVILVKRSLYEDGNETAKLDKLSIPYVVVDYSTVDEQMDAIKLVGEVCGGKAADKADAIAAYYQKTIKLVEKRAAELKPSERKTVYHSINEPLLADGSGSLGEDWISLCGGIDVSSQETATGSEGDFTATLEQIYNWNPDVVICSTAGSCKSIKADSKWQGLAAVSAGKVYNIPVSTSRWGQRGDPETFLAMLWLGKTLYPSLYKDINLKKEVVSYYRDVIGIDIDDATWKSIVAGTGLRVDGGGTGDSGAK